MKYFWHFAAHLRRNALHTRRDKVECLITAAGEPVFHHDRRHLDMFRHIPAKGGLQIQRLAGNAREFLVTHRTERAQRAANTRHRLGYTG